MHGNKSPTPAELTILIAGALMFLASFLTFAFDTNAWGTYLFPIATLLPLYGTVMAVQIGLTKFTDVDHPEGIAGFTWEQVHLVLGLLAGFMAIGWLLTDLSHKGVGLWIQVLGGFALAAGGLMLQRERATGAIG